MLKDYLIFIVAIVVLGVGFVFLEQTFSSPQPDTTKATQSQKPIQSQKFTSSDNRVVVTFPSTWYVQDTTQNGAYGNFGQILQTWTITNYPPPNTPSSMTENGVTIDFSIQQGAGNLSLQQLLDCGMKTTSCETIGINSEQFLKSTATLNTGISTVSVATFYDQNILTATAMIGTGDKKAANQKEVDKILNSITFSPLSK